MALGASAGGLESLGRILEALPATFPAPVLVALHLDPNHRSQIVSILQARTRLHVVAARSGLRIQAGKVYVALPNKHLELAHGKLRLTQAPRVSYSRPSIDVLFASVAKAAGPGAIVAVLSGTGSDGAQGVAAIKEHGDLAVAEDAATAAFDGMPAASGRTGLLDAVLPVGQIAAFLMRAATRRVIVTERQWHRLLTLLETRSGARFSLYRSSTLHRRLQQRLVARNCRTMAAYVQLLESDTVEVDRLVAAFLIKVSAFTRDPPSWRALARHIQPLAATRSEVRAWSAGCATGEEAYTLAMLLARELGFDGARWKVFATDLDEGALTVARLGRYTDEQLKGVKLADRRSFFVRDGRLWRVNKALRSRVVFGRHDLLHDPPLPGIDLLTCRNVLIYFKPHERRRTLDRLAAAMTDGGILFLGRSEGLRPVPGFSHADDTIFFRHLGVSPAMAKASKPARRTSKSTRSPQARPPRGRSLAGADPELLEQQDLNEELQSRNEELETVNEELQSLNDELSTMEEQMRGLAEEHRGANDFLRLLLDASNDVLIACDVDNRVTFWNKAAIKRFRLSPIQALGGELFDLVPALDTPPLRAASAKVRKPGRGGRVVVKEPDAEYVLEPLPAAGKRRRYLLRVSPKT